MTGHRLDNQATVPSTGRNLSLYCWVLTSSESHSASYPMDTKGSFPRGKVVREAWSFTSTPPYIFMVWCLSTGTMIFRRQGNVTLRLTYQNTRVLFTGLKQHSIINSE
jgi:hypothetical protein